MKNKKAKLCALLLLGFGLISAQAQETPTASGGDASSSGGSVSYSVGQVIYTTNIGTTGSVAQGVQQPYEIYSIGIEETEGQILLTVYPNPTTDFLILKVENYDNENLFYQLYDISGKLLENEKLGGNETSIDMSNFLPATYFLKVIDNNKEIKTFKIIKN
ncbi:MAG: T9SS type A sorting domain-containing protein [Bacteroidales bacterium]|nr:T9SS type A sorting domain-containing protein [Bacteroidales bacterium]